MKRRLKFGLSLMLLAMYLLILFSFEEAFRIPGRYVATAVWVIGVACFVL